MRETILSNATENCYIILYDLISRLWYIATSGPFCKDRGYTYRNYDISYINAMRLVDMLPGKIVK